MARITSFLLCDNAVPTFVQQGDKQMPSSQLNNPIQVLRPFAIPGMFSFSVIIGIGGIDTSCAHKLTVLFEGPDGGKVQEAVIDTPVEQSPVAISIDYQGIFLTMDNRNLIISKEGLYKYRISIDGEMLGEYIIPALKA